MDYYRVKKLAYHFIKRSQQPVCMMFDEPQDGVMTLYTVNNTPIDQSISYVINDLYSGEIVASGVTKVKADSSLPTVSLPLPKEETMLHICWEANGVFGSNHFTPVTKDADYDRYYSLLCKAGYGQFEGFQ